MTADGDVQAYLARLGLEWEQPSVAALMRIHRAQVERVPYETTWIHMNEPCGIDRANSMRRVARLQRSGYCFTLNGGLSALLEALGYDVTLHGGVVHGPEGPVPEAMVNHLVLLVHGLATESNPGGIWYVDAGLGDALYEPVPLVSGPFAQGPLTFRLVPSDGPDDGWHFLHDPLGSFTGMVFSETPTTMEAFGASHLQLSTSPESGFVKTVTVQRRDETGVDILRGQVLSRVGRPATVDRTLETRGEWFDTLAEQFDLPLTDVATEVLDALWTKVHSAHERWHAGLTDSGS